MLELLSRVARVIKARNANAAATRHDTRRVTLAPRVQASRVACCAQDYCGVLTEDSLRKNFILVYELLDEMIDYGCASRALPIRKPRPLKT